MVIHYVADFYYKWLIFPLFFSMVFVDPGCELLKKVSGIISELPDNWDREKKSCQFPQYRILWRKLPSA